MRSDELGLFPDNFTSINTHFGRVDLMNPGPGLQQAHAEDLALITFRIARFSGHGKYSCPPKSVLYHLLHVIQILEVETEFKNGESPAEIRAITLAGALHDLHEAISGDVSRPMKMAMRVGGYSSFDHIEELAMEAVFDRFGGNYSLAHHPAIVNADLLACGWEMDYLFGPGTADRLGIQAAKHPLILPATMSAYTEKIWFLGAKNVSKTQQTINKTNVINYSKGSNV